jgi:hypothetical protein
MITQAVPVRKSLIDISPPVAVGIVSAIYSIGDFMKEEIIRLNLISGNYKSGLFWSKLNTKVNEVIGLSDGKSIVMRSGYHEFLLVGQDGYKLTFMRESRFRDVQAAVKMEGKLSYQNLLVQQNNSGLEAEVAQMSLFPMHEYDAEEMSERFDKLFYKAQEINSTVGYYVMILFDIDSAYELRKIKAVIVDPNFDCVEEQDWSHFIPVKETAIVEKVSNSESPSNTPSRGMSLTSKALERKMHQVNSRPENNFDSSKK